MSFQIPPCVFHSSPPSHTHTQTHTQVPGGDRLGVLHMALENKRPTPLLPRLQAEGNTPPTADSSTNVVCRVRACVDVCYGFVCTPDISLYFWPQPKFNLAMLSCGSTPFPIEQIPTEAMTSHLRWMVVVLHSLWEANPSSFQLSSATRWQASSAVVKPLHFRLADTSLKSTPARLPQHFAIYK